MVLAALMLAAAPRIRPHRNRRAAHRPGPAGRLYPITGHGHPDLGQSADDGRSAVRATSALPARSPTGRATGIDRQPADRQQGHRVRPAQARAPRRLYGDRLRHPTTGTGPECAPSLDRCAAVHRARRHGMVKAGYVRRGVTTGFGLWCGSYHPYLVPKTAGYNLIDSGAGRAKAVPSPSSTLGGTRRFAGRPGRWRHECTAVYARGDAGRIR
jgi:hypothetical protein